MLALLLASPASAFCGTFVGGTGASLTNHSSQVVMAREGTTTTLTLSADYQGDASDFAIVIPIPEVLDATDVRIIDPELITRLDTWSTPRAVDYTCDDVFSSEQTMPVGVFGCGVGAGFGCSNADSMITPMGAPLRIQ